MSEKELYERLQKTIFVDILDIPNTKWNHKVQSIPQTMDDCNSKLVEFLIHKSGLDALFNVPVTSSSKFIAPVEFDAFFNAYDSEHIRVSGQVEAQYSARYDGTPLYDIQTYDQKRYEALLPQLVETYPLLFIAELDKQGLLHGDLFYAVSDYIEEHYFNIDTFEVASWSVVDGVFQFEIEPREGYKKAFAFGDYLGYRIVERGTAC